MPVSPCRRIREPDHHWQTHRAWHKGTGDVGTKRDGTQLTQGMPGRTAISRCCKMGYLAGLPDQARQARGSTVWRLLSLSPPLTLATPCSADWPVEIIFRYHFSRQTTISWSFLGSTGNMILSNQGQKPPPGNRALAGSSAHLRNILVPNYPVSVHVSERSWCLWAQRRKVT